MASVASVLCFIQLFVADAIAKATDSLTDSLWDTPQGLAVLGGLVAYAVFLLWRSFLEVEGEDEDEEEDELEEDELEEDEEDGERS